MKVSLEAVLAHAKSALSSTHYRRLSRTLKHGGRACVGGRVLLRAATVSPHRKRGVKLRRRMARASRRANRAGR